MNIITVTAPAVFPVTLADVYLHLRLDPDDSPPTHPDDDMLNRHIATATGEVEKMARRALVRQSLALFVENMHCPITLLRPPVISVTSVKYRDGDNALQTLDPANYYVTDDVVPQVRFVTAFSQPTLYCRPDAVRVDYRAGYDATESPDDAQALRANIPSQLKDAILIGVQLLYDALSPEQRKELERAREALISPFRVLLGV